MSKWTSKDAVINFANAAAIEKMYIRRFQALYLTMVARAAKFKNTNTAQPNDDDMKNAIDGTEGFLRYDDMTSEDAAVYACLRGSADQNGKVDYSKLDGSIKDKEIDDKFIENIKKTNEDGFDDAYNKLSKIQDEAETKAKKEIAEGKEIQFEDEELAVITNTMGKESSDAVKAIKSKYKTWKNVEGSGVMQAMGGTDYESKFWDDKQKYKNWTEMAAKAKDTIYDGVMKSETNIVTAPLKLFFFALHEMLNPNSFFRRNVIGKVREQFTKYKQNKDAQKKLQELGYNVGSESTEQQSEEPSKNFTRSIQQLQRDVIKGWNLKGDLEFLGVKLNEQPQEQQQVQPKQEEQPKPEPQPQEQPKPEENPAADTSAAPPQENASFDLDKVLAFAKSGISPYEILNEADQPKEEPSPEEKEADAAAEAGEDETEEQNPTQEDDIEKFRETVANVVLRYNFMIYIFLRAFAGTYGTDENFRMFSFQPFVLKKNEKAEEKEQPKQEEPTKQEDTDVEITDSDKKNWDALSDEEKKQLTDLVKQTFNLKDENVEGDKALVAVKKAWLKLKDDKTIVGQRFNKFNVGKLFTEAKTPRFTDYLRSRLNEDEQTEQQPEQQAQPEQQTEQPQEQPQEEQTNRKELVLGLTTGIDHWTKRDPVLARLIQRSPAYRVQLQKDAKFATYYAVANFMEEVFDEYKQYVTALRSHKNFTKIVNTDIRITGIKNLRIQQVIQHARECLNALKNATNGFDSELTREWRSMETMKKITNITQFLIIKKMNFEDIMKFIDQMDPRLEQIRRPGNIISELSSEDANKIFGEKGLRFAFIDATKTEDENKAKKEAEKPESQKKEQEAPAAQEQPAQTEGGEQNKAEGQ